MHRTNLSISPLRATLIVALCASLVVLGCDDDGDNESDATGGSAGSSSKAGSKGNDTSAGQSSSNEGGSGATGSSNEGGGDSQGGSGPDEAPSLYVSSLRVFNPEGSVGYLFSVPSLDAGTEVDLSKAVEIEDGWAFGDAKPYFYTATIFEPTMTRWEVSPEGKFEKGPTLDFTNEGVKGTYTAAATPIWSPEKSFFVDSESLQVVVWNPTTMELIDTIPLDAEPQGELVAKWTSGIAVTPDRIYVSTFWATGDGAWTQFGDKVRLFTIDPDTLKVIETSDDDRCQSLGPSGVASDGTAYFSPWDYHTTVREIFGAGFGSTACAVRVLPGKATLDSDYEVNLSDLVGGLPAGGMQLVDDETALIHVWDNSILDATPEDWADKRFGAGYYWYRWTIGEAEAEILPDQQPGTEGSAFINVDGKFTSMAPNEEYTETTVRELQADGTFKDGIVLPGWATTMLRAY